MPTGQDLLSCFFYGQCVCGSICNSLHSSVWLPASGFTLLVDLAWYSKGIVRGVWLEHSQVLTVCLCISVMFFAQKHNVYVTLRMHAVGQKH